MPVDGGLCLWSGTKGGLGWCPFRGPIAMRLDLPLDARSSHIDGHFRPLTRAAQAHPTPRTQMRPACRPTCLHSHLEPCGGSCVSARLFRACPPPSPQSACGFTNHPPTHTTPFLTKFRRRAACRFPLLWPQAAIAAPNVHFSLRGRGRAHDAPQLSGPRTRPPVDVRSSSEWHHGSAHKAVHPVSVARRSLTF